MDASGRNREWTRARCWSRVVGMTLVTAICLGVASPAVGKLQFCSDTARMLFAACKAGLADDTLVRKAVCMNVADPVKQASCHNQATAERDEARQLCHDQRDTRLATCAALGEDRYDPDIDPARFDDPRSPTNPNPYFPLTVGYRWEYRAGNEVDIVEIVDETKLIAGVRCVVARDHVFRDGFLAEATDDWYAPARNGETWYFGEEVMNLEVFAGDAPQRPELVTNDGSFKAGRDGDKPGIIFLASPKVGDFYVEEASLGNAEDVTEILSTTYSYGAAGAELDELVPPELAALFCAAADCVVTKNFSLLEPGIFARKYYAPGIGVFLEIEPDESKAIRLTSCNVDPRCDMLLP